MEMALNSSKQNEVKCRFALYDPQFLVQGAWRGSVVMCILN